MMATPVQESISAERVAAELEDILASAEFHTEESMLSKLISDLLDRIQLGHIEGASTALQWLLYIAIGAAFVWLVYIAVRFGPRRDSRKATEVDGSSVRQRVAALLRDARAARRAGDLRLALRLYLFALIVGLGERGEMRYHDAWTNRELLRRGRPSPRARELLERLVGDLEAQEFGRAAIAVEDVARLEDLCRTHLGEAALPAAGGPA